MLNYYLAQGTRFTRMVRRRWAVGSSSASNSPTDTDDEVVEYALSRSLSLALVAQYQTQLPDKALLRAKLHEFYQLTVGEQGEGG